MFQERETVLAAGSNRMVSIRTSEFLFVVGTVLEFSVRKIDSDPNFQNLAHKF